MYDQRKIKCILTTKIILTLRFDGLVEVLCQRKIAVMGKEKHEKSFYCIHECYWEQKYDFGGYENFQNRQRKTMAICQR